MTERMRVPKEEKHVDEVEIVAAVLRGVASGNIEGEVLWMMPEKQDHLRGTLWSGPPMTLKGHPVVVIPVPKEEK